MVAMIGRFIPISRAAAVNTSPTTTCFQPLKLNFFWIRPNTTANAMKSSEIHPAAPFALALSARDTTPSVSTYALNVPATMSANAAITISVNSQQKPKEQTTSGLADVFLNQKSHGLTFIFNTCVQCTEIGNCAEEDAT